MFKARIEEIKKQFESEISICIDMEEWLHAGDRYRKCHIVSILPDNGKCYQQRSENLEEAITEAVRKAKEEIR